jgi:hypothetical protein
MKYLAYFKYNIDDFGKCLEKAGEARKKREKNPEKYPTVIGTPYFIDGGEEGFEIMEATEEEQLSNVVLHWGSLLKWKFVPIHDFNMVVKQFESM